MQVTVFLYGTLRERFKDYQHHMGFGMELPTGALARDILSTVGISTESGVVVVQNGRILKMDESVKDGGCLDILQPIHGG